MIKRGLIVSCQAKPDEPLYGNIIMAKLAKAAEIGGASAVRVNTTADVIACLKEISIPLIGLIKKEYEGFYPYITPTMAEVDDLYKIGCRIIAIDATSYDRPDGLTLEEFVKNIREKYDVEILADISTVEEGVYAASLGVDYVATTLYGYTPDTVDKNSELITELREPNFEIIKELKAKIDTPIVAEGRFWDAKNAVKALDCGAYAVTIGAGITRPQIITKKIVDEMNEFIDKEN
ncbi:hypothetical protein HMPREF9709_01462 [Helcococcus kunzii ATCC 51366]|uniref:Putative N-acetylmannosamine-6-phosphate 2-epimerase n=1 Tax=Helcococcus kunzii ATCC 51366 TaxID=883114 RepID=H3NQ51_9FIRM|nr:N-acetylmannosamine-6-phosphate 2-epimerase [Helcococcus kunzii]EHR32531.1 hypothetical protein HMPREF9709_01462 [Helcococcus kunzii ATCC 51366]MCT1796362.1 N-acetylmannosamine-6-phosphate 2-epimerase [Helcococcus kunzii]MCT1989412.1 N-acetylmannosamine-6-phosphate 2-epimerase [Helcococcus kunzii]